MNQTIPHIGGSVIIDFTGPEHLCGQCRPLNLRGDGIMVPQQLPEVGELRILHISQPLDVLNQVSLLFCDLFRCPSKSSLPLLFRFAFPAQAFVAQRRSTAGTSIFECHRIHLLSEYKKHLTSTCHRDRPTQGVKDRKRGTISGFRYRKLLRLYSFFYLNGGLAPIDTTHRNLSLLLSTNKSRICTAAGTA